MTLNVNGSPMSLVNVNGTRMEVVNVNGTEVYRAQNGNVTLAYTGGVSGSFNPGLEDLNRHFVLVGVRFSGSGLALPATPTIDGTPMNLITRGSGSGGDDGGITGVYTIKIPTGTSPLTVAQAATAFTFCAIYRVTGIFEMTTSTVLSAQSGNGLSGSKTSSSNGCFFGASVSNFATPAYPTPNTTGLLFDAGQQGRTAASNATTGPTQSVSITGNQMNSFAIFGYDLF